MKFRSILVLLFLGLCTQAVFVNAQQTQPAPEPQNASPAGGNAAAAPAPQPAVWLVGSLKEIKSAKPVIGSATLPVSLVRSLLDAVPQTRKAEFREDGFDVDVIAKAVFAMPLDQTFEMTKKDYNLVIRKMLIPAQSAAQPSMLHIDNDSFKLPIPLAFTGTAVGVLQMAFEELRGMDEPLNRAFEELKQTPPGVLLTGQDYLTEGWLTIRLE